MTTLEQGKLPPLPTKSAEAETAALGAQIINTVANEGQNVTNAPQKTDDSVPQSEKPSEAGLKNYFVRANAFTLHCKLITSSASSPLALHSITFWSPYAALPQSDLALLCLS